MALPQSVSLFVPTYNAGPEFPGIFAAMLDQDLDAELEVLVTDSGSTDGTLEFLQAQPVALTVIDSADFNHGRTREEAIRRARGEVVVLATQDARPADRQWIRALLRNYDDPAVAGAYSAQRPRPDANPFSRHRLESWAATANDRRVQRVETLEEFEALAPLEKLGRITFDNVSSSVRRSTALEIPFRERAFGEDLDWSYRVIRAGLSIVFEPESRVVHSHNNSIWYETKRVYLDHQNLHRLLSVHTVPRWLDVAGCTAKGVVELNAVVKNRKDLSVSQRLLWRLKTAPYSFGQNLAQFLGARSVSRLAAGRRSAFLLDRLFRGGV